MSANILSRRPAAPALRSALAVSISLLALGAMLATAQGQTPLPAVDVNAPRPAPAAGAPSGGASRGRPARAPRATRPAPVQQAAPTQPAPSQTPGSLTAPNTQQAQEAARQVPGAVSVVPNTEFRNRQATTIKDALDYVPGVFVQPKWGEDSRLSIRGSGLSRNFHLRGIQLYMDGIPINTADGYGDFQEIDPSAYRYIEVFKGANALRFGSNSLGGAINFVMPSGYDAPRIAAGIDAGSFGFHRVQTSSGGVHGPFDYFITVSRQEQQGFRQHSDGHALRGAGNFGYRLSSNVETRFYFNANEIRQRIPGEVDKVTALTNPRQANPANVLQDWQRNIDSIRIANKTTISVGPTTAEVGAFFVTRHLRHPIPVWLDWKYEDYGLFGRVVDDRNLGGFRNRLTAGFNIHNGAVDVNTYLNFPGAVKGPLLDKSKQTSTNTSLYLENAFYLRPTFALIGGLQYLKATRDQVGIAGMAPGATANARFDIASPRAGFVWDATPTVQVFGNISRSAEVPSFGEGMTVVFSNVRAQRATTFEIGTRGRHEGFKWDFSIYRANVTDELQCLAFMMGMCDVRNAPKTIHQGVEAGFGVSLLRPFFADPDLRDRLWLNVAYTLNDFRFSNDPMFGNNELPGVPKHYVRSELMYKHTNGLFFGPNAEWAPRPYFVDNANTFKSAGYVLFGLRAGFDNGGPVTGYIEARNLANRKYISSASIVDVYNPATTANIFNPGNGRAVYAGLKFKW